MIHFVCGLPGTGKTTRITEQIARDVAQGHRTLLLVPEQQTVEAERTMLSLLPASAQLTFEVLNFSRLANKLFREFGGLSYHYITGGMKHLLMWHTLRELSGMIREFGAAPEGDTAMPAMMLSQIAEFKAGGISATHLESVAQKLPEGHSLRGKLSDLALIYAAYEGTVKNTYDDSADDIGKLAKLLEHHRFFEGYRIYIDSFTSFTAEELRVLRRMFAQAEEVTVTFATDSPHSEAVELSSITETLRRLMVEAGDRARITCLETPHRFTSPELARIGRHLWRYEVTGENLPPIPEEAQGAVSLVRCRNPYEEAEATAAEIMALLESGYRRREIAVIARNAEDYRGILDSVLDKAGISYFFSEKTDLPAKPLISMIFSALAIKTRRFRNRDVIAYLKSGIPPIDTRSADIFENYVNTWNITGDRFLGDPWTMNPDGYLSELSPRGEEILQTANRVRTEITAPLIRLCAQLDEAQNVSALCEAVRAFLEDINADARMRELSARALRNGDRKEAAENAATFRTVLESLSAMSATMGDTAMSVEEFSTALRLVFANTELGTIPTGSDQITIGSASMLRVSGIRCAILVGLCDGEFPARTAERGLLSDNDRKTLSELGVALSGDSRDSAAEELLYCYRAMTLASERLVLMYRDTTASGNATAPSPAFRRVAELLPHITVRSFGSPEQRLISKALAFEALPSLAGTPYERPLKALLAEDPQYASLLDRSRRSVSNTHLSVSPETAARVFGRDMGLTQSRLDKFVSCHLAYYGRYILSLMENERAAFRFSDSGTFIHRILEVFLTAVTDGNGLRRDVAFEEIRQLVVRETERYLAALFPSKSNLTGRLRHLFRRLSKLAVSISMELYEELLDSDFTPKLLEAAIGSRGELGIEPPTVELTDGSRISIYGTIDRVDVFRTGGQVYIKVVDYKTGGKAFSLADIEKGLNTQLLLYLFAVCGSHSPKLKDALGCREGDTLTPAGALYMSTDISPVKLESKTEETDALALAASGIRRDGILLDRDEVLDAVSNSHKKHLLAGVALDRDDKRKQQVLKSEMQLTALEAQLTETLRRIGTEMRSGNATACIAQGDSEACEYCRFKPLCRPSPTEEDDQPKGDRHA